MAMLEYLIYFNLNTDELSSKLNATNKGCVIGGKNVNHLGYADDICLISTTPTVMQELLIICNHYASDHDLIFNTHESFCMFFHPKHIRLKTLPELFLNNRCLEYVKHCKYLSVFIQNASCEMDIKRQLRKFYGNANLLLRKICKCSDNVKISLFKSYCANLYCSQFWINSRICETTKLRVAYNNSFRRLMKLDYRCSASSMFVNNNVLSFKELSRKSLFNFIERLKTSENHFIKCSMVPQHLLFSLLWMNWYHSLYTRFNVLLLIVLQA